MLLLEVVASGLEPEVEEQSLEVVTSGLKSEVEEQLSDSLVPVVVEELHERGAEPEVCCPRKLVLASQCGMFAHTILLSVKCEMVVRS